MWERSAPCIDISVGADVYETFMYVFTWPMVWPEILCHKARFVRFTRPSTSYGRGNISPSSHADFGCSRSVSSSLPRLSTLELSEIWFLSDKLKYEIVMDLNLHRYGFGKLIETAQTCYCCWWALLLIYLTQIQTRVVILVILWQLENKSAVVWTHLHLCCMLYAWYCIVSSDNV